MASSIPSLEGVHGLHVGAASVLWWLNCVHLPAVCVADECRQQQYAGISQHALIVSDNSLLNRAMTM
jgi:hypothetical protein